MKHLLDNIVWHSLTGPQAVFAMGGERARRYAPGFSGIIGFADMAQPDFDALAPLCEAGEHFYCLGWSGPVSPGWMLEAETLLVKMIWEGGAAPADDAPDALPLGAEHVPEAMALVALTRPGPFGPRTIELGDYFGIFEQGHLVAMAGERMAAATLREISGVCTQPGHQGKGYARRLMHKLIHRQLQRGETPFLHVMRDNAGAIALYRRMGFGVYREMVVRVVSRC